MNWNEILEMIPWQKILTKMWIEVLPKLREKVEDTDSIWDDKALDALTYLVNKFLKPDEIENECDNCPNC